MTNSLIVPIEETRREEKDVTAQVQERLAQVDKLEDEAQGSIELLTRERNSLKDLFPFDSIFLLWHPNHLKTGPQTTKIWLV
jgi:tRNA (Thr-GGU) A37 N-methylase